MTSTYSPQQFDHIPFDIRFELDLYAWLLTCSPSRNRFWTDVLTDDKRRLFRNDPAQFARAYPLIAHYWATEHRVPFEIAVVELAQRLDLLPTNRYAELLCALGFAPPVPMRPDRPQWDRQAGQLRYRGAIIRNVRTTARGPTNVANLLTRFEQASWPTAIDDPLGEENREKLRNTVDQLNKGLIGIRFRALNDNATACWEPIPFADTARRPTRAPRARSP